MDPVWSTTRASLMTYHKLQSWRADYVLRPQTLLLYISIKYEFLVGEDLLDSLEDAPPRLNWDHNNPVIDKIFLDVQEDGDIKEKLGSLATCSCNKKFM